MNIKLNAKLCAYTKGIIPNTSDFITDVINDGAPYIRSRDVDAEHGEWVKLTDIIDDQVIEVEEGSGLDLTSIDDQHYNLSIRQWTGNVSDLPDILDTDKVYYGFEATPNLYINGGTAYSTIGISDLSEESFNNNIIGGASASVNFEIGLKPINSKGESI